MKIIHTYWFKQTKHLRPLGIVVVEDKAGKREACIGRGLGLNVTADSADIVATGAKIQQRILEAILKELKR